MRSHETWIALFFLLGMVGCASSPAPRGFLTKPDDAVFLRSGTWVQIELQEEFFDFDELQGELIAADSDSIWVLVPVDERDPSTGEGELWALAWTEVYGGHAWGYVPAQSRAAWTLLGVASTASHGYFLVISVPVWAMTGAISTAGRNIETRIPVEYVNLEEVRAWSRFPAGIPPLVDRATLLMNGVEAWTPLRR